MQCFEDVSYSTSSSACTLLMPCTRAIPSLHSWSVCKSNCTCFETSHTRLKALGLSRRDQPLLARLEFSVRGSRRPRWVRLWRQRHSCGRWWRRWRVLLAAVVHTGDVSAASLRCPRVTLENVQSSHGASTTAQTHPQSVYECH